MEIFEKAALLHCCQWNENGEVSEKDSVTMLDTMPKLMRILPPKSHYISFSFGHLETIEKTQRVDGDFLNTEKKNLHFRTKTNPCGQGLREIRHHSVCCCDVAAL